VIKGSFVQGSHINHQNAALVCGSRVLVLSTTTLAPRVVELRSERVSQTSRTRTDLCVPYLLNPSEISLADVQKPMNDAAQDDRYMVWRLSGALVVHLGKSILRFSIYFFFFFGI
jgi:hypothetical protein